MDDDDDMMMMFLFFFLCFSFSLYLSKITHYSAFEKSDQPLCIYIAPLQMEDSQTEREDGSVLVQHRWRRLRSIFCCCFFFAAAFASEEAK